MASTDIQMALGGLVIAWNRAELKIRQMIALLWGEHAEHPKIDILTNELSAVELNQAFAAFVHHFVSEPEIRTRLEWIAESFDRLRAHRNFYVHGIKVALDFSDAGAIGMVSSSTAKGELIVYKNQVSPKELHWVIEQLDALAIQQMMLVTHIDLWRTEDRSKIGPLPPLPALPDSLKKTATHYPCAYAPPAPSQASPESAEKPKHVKMSSQQKRAEALKRIGIAKKRGA
ncbi:hypothetical protein [Dongia sedimenti]|uniref:Uncharacterized protein n=1 Tax=Dongia sedimenti TaxID=3064282 RepID=A0ABU0YEZ6_9PROT|nr:hypothetical protein [Rhodospirillaceae bacterium R-7]